MNTTARLRQIANEWYCGTESSPAPLVEQIAAEFVLIPRTEIPAVSSDRDYLYTSLAQEKCQPRLVFSAEDGDKPGEWNRRIAYANLAVAEAVDARNAEQEAAKAAEVAADNDKLDAEALALFNAERAGNGWGPLPDIPVIPTKWRTLALAARRIHGVTK